MISASSNDGELKLSATTGPSPSGDEHRQEDDETLVEPVSLGGLVWKELEGKWHGECHGDALQRACSERRLQDDVHQYEPQENGYGRHDLPPEANLVFVQLAPQETGYGLDELPQEAKLFVLRGPPGGIAPPYFSRAHPVDQESDEAGEQRRNENPRADREPVLGGHERNDRLDRQVGLPEAQRHDAASDG